LAALRRVASKGVYAGGGSITEGRGDDKTEPKWCNVERNDGVFIVTATFLSGECGSDVLAERPGALAPGHGFDLVPLRSSGPAR
jgi:hypothetical protein